MINAQRLVAAGVAALDGSIPDWYEKINIDVLELNSYEQCILGQLFGDYYTGLDLLGVANPMLNGFWPEYTYSCPVEGVDEKISSSALTDEWVKVITERKKEGANV